LRFTITPLGGAGRSVNQIVHAIVSYLQPAKAVEPVPDPPCGASGPARYYADSSEGPGRWSGHGATAAGLVGTVVEADFASVLAGRDPATGRRLITAQGSAGRRSKLGVGTATRTGPDGEPWYDARDAAAVLDLTVTEIDRMLDIGATLANQARFGPGSNPVLVPGSVPPGSYLIATVDPAGDRWVTDSELCRCETARAEGVTPAQITAAGADDDLIPLCDAARLIGVTTRYLRRLAVYYEDHRTDIDTTVASGGRVRQAYLIAERGTRNRWFVTRRELAAFVERRRPPAVRVAYDLTLTTEKSLGVLALLSDDTTRTTVLTTIREANDWAIDWLEANAAVARARGEAIAVDGWTAASFQHLTSRALDPHVHHHNVIANTVTDHNGDRRALDARPLYQHAQAASALATALMRHDLTGRLGVRWRPSRHGGWEIAGISDDVLREFSQRRNEIDDALRELEMAIGRGSSLDELQQIVLQTRPAKQHTVLDTLRRDWWDRATAIGFTPDDLTACTHQATAPSIDTDLDVDAIHAALAGRDGICHNLSVFNRGDLLTALVNLPHPAPAGDESGEPQPLLVTLDQLEELADSFLASSHVVDLGGGRYTTAEMLAVQQRIVDRYEDGVHQGAHITPTGALAAALARHQQLSDEQQALVRGFCSSGHRIQCAIGRAGAGKTTAMAAAVDAWTSAGYRVLGTAVKGEATRTLAAATGIPTETLAWHLAHPDPQTSPLDASTVLIVDEASTISDRDLDHLGWLAAATGATLRLIGDPAQHSAVEAGGMYRVLCEQHPDHTPELTTTHRLRNPHDQAAADALRDGDIDRAFTELEAAGHLHIIDDELDFYRDTLTRWWHNHQHGLNHPMVDRRNHTRRHLNQLAHTLLRVNGHIHADEIPASDQRAFSVGDRVAARAPARHLHPEREPRDYIRNGATGTITHIHRDTEQPTADTLTVNFDGLGTITVPRAFFDRHQLSNGRSEVGIDHAYALTSYAVQGSTHPASASRIDNTATRAETYVDITRGQQENHLYLTAAADPLDGEHLPKAPDPPIDDMISDRLIRSEGEVTAWELHEALDADGDDVGQAIGL
jgi:conjugative relaxase-like TrwC/TraI family protein